MREYKLYVGNLRKELIVILFALLPTIALFIILYEINGQFFHENSFIMTLIALFPTMVLIIRSIINKKKIGLKITEMGIESKYKETIKWQEILYCSWETFRGNPSIYLKLKDNTRLSIGPWSTLQNYSQSYEELRIFFKEIQKINNELPTSEKFKVYIEKNSGIELMVILFFMVGIVVFFVVFSIIK